MPRLYVLSGPDLGRTFEVGDGAKLGRATSCAVHLRDASVSRQHAQLVRDGEVWRIVDTGSRNGVMIAGTRIETAALVDGAEFQVGEVVLRFRSDLTASAVAPPAPAEPDEITLEEDPVAAAPASGLDQTTLAPRRSLAARTVVDRGPRILQYRRIQGGAGFFGADLAQQPLWIRVGAGLLALAVFAAIFLIAFKGTSFLKGRAIGDPGDPQAEGER